MSEKYFVWPDERHENVWDVRDAENDDELMTTFWAENPDPEGGARHEAARLNALVAESITRITEEPEPPAYTGPERRKVKQVPELAVRRFVPVDGLVGTVALAQPSRKEDQ